MLTEQFAAALGIPTTKIPSSSGTKDVGVFVFESQPLTQPRSAFKKSTALQNCVAVSASHVFAAQADKAVVNVYSREKGSQEAIVPFPERIACVALACQDSVLVAGSAEGRIFLWETHTGRLVVTSQAHLQAVTAVAADPESNFLLSGSADSSIHVWSIADLLSFSNQNTHSPLHTLTAHRSAITSLAVGHSSGSYNVLVSASKDNTVIVWDYRNANLLRTILLPSTPLCLALDPADRAVYTGYEDGSVQSLNFFSEAFAAHATDDRDNTKNPLYDEAQAALPVQPPATTRWSPPSEDIGATLSCMLSYDGSVLTTGHASGKILHWDIPLARYSATYPPTASPLPAPVTNLILLPTTGFAAADKTNAQATRTHTIVKPKHGAFDTGDIDGAIPGDYKISGQFTTSFAVADFDPSSHVARSEEQQSDFTRALTHPSFPSDLLARGLADFAAWNPASTSSSSSSAAPSTAATEPTTRTSASSAASKEGDFMSLDAEEPNNKPPTLEQKNAQLQSELAALRKAQRTALLDMEKMRKENAALTKRLAGASEGAEKR
ncbi:hypothetical protein AAFC00_005789 [Neodothiora populina]|uniref:Pre-rRNA-processing protein IPI3 n=1 Tax=Neodothiora populina TaxID=2781224 RepID=A0ABR3P643_9PEZI